MLETPFLIEIFCILGHANNTRVTSHRMTFEKASFKVVELLHINKEA